MAKIARLAASITRAFRLKERFEGRLELGIATLEGLDDYGLRLAKRLMGRMFHIV